MEQGRASSVRQQAPGFDDALVDPLPDLRGPDAAILEVTIGRVDAGRRGMRGEEAEQRSQLVLDDQRVAVAAAWSRSG